MTPVWGAARLSPLRSPTASLRNDSRGHPLQLPSLDLTLLRGPVEPKLRAPVRVDNQPVLWSRRWVAIPSALSTSFVVWVLSIAQPTTKRENVSSTTQQ